MGRPGWTAEVEVDADLGKVPGDPVEAAKYAVDQVRRLAEPFVVVHRFNEDGSADTWMVDTSNGDVTGIGPTAWGPSSSEERIEAEWSVTASPCQQMRVPGDGGRDHGGGLFRLTSGGEFEHAMIACGNHLADLVSEEGALVVPYEED